MLARGPCFSALMFACLVACSARPAPGTGDEAESTSDATQTQTSGSEDATGPSLMDLPGNEDTGEPGDACDCDEGSICAADCQEGVPSIPVTPAKAINFRCISDPACPPEDLDNVACRELVCGSPYIFLVEDCYGANDPPGIEMLCDSRPELTCDLAVQDCPEGEKCIARPLDEEGLFPTMCVPLEGMDMLGEPCTADGAPDFTDSCGLDGMCWGGELTAEPFAGVCLGYCDEDADPSCPEGSICEQVAEWLALCVPSP